MSDEKNLEPALAALLARMSRRPVPSPNPEMLSLAEGLSSAPLSAFARALGSYLWTPDFGRFEMDAESVEENGFYDEIVESLEPLGKGGAEGICIGTTGGGDETLLMVADDTHPAGYIIYKFAYDGVPYDNGQSLEAIGQLEHLLHAVEAEGTLDPEWAAVLADAGLSE